MRGVNRMDPVALYRAQADDCMSRARTDSNESDKPLWVTLAQSWRQLAEQADQVNSQARSAAVERAIETALS